MHLFYGMDFEAVQNDLCLNEDVHVILYFQLLVLLQNYGPLSFFAFFFFHFFCHLTQRTELRHALDFGIPISLITVMV